MSRPNFDGLRDLHNCANNLLHSPIIRESLAHQRHEKWVDDISEATLTMLDLCGTTKDILLLVKDHLQDLQSSYRRLSYGDSGFEAAGAYNLMVYRKKYLKKEMLKCLRSLKGMKKKNKSIITNSTDLSLSPMLNHNLAIVVDVLREVRVAFISILESLFSLVSIPRPHCQKSSTKLSSSSSLALLTLLRVMNGQKSRCEMREATFNKTQNCKRLEGLEMAMEEVEVELECIFRRLIQTRVSLLNILTLTN